MDLNRIDRKYAKVTVTATLADGEPADIDEPVVSLLAPRATPTRDTAWTAAERTGGYLLVDKDWRVISTHPTFAEALAAWSPASGNKVASRWRVLLAGPDADPTDALATPAGGADLWIRVADEPEVDAEKIERISVQ